MRVSNIIGNPSVRLRAIVTTPALERVLLYLVEFIFHENLVHAVAGCGSKQCSGITDSWIFR
jgi:hypothetical protein